jgi:hypothetical protein
MRTTKSESLFVILAALIVGTAACSDTGDNSSTPQDGSADGTMGDDGSVNFDSGGGDTGSGLDSTMPVNDSSTPVDTGSSVDSAADTGSTDSSEGDSTLETGTPESGAPETGPQDAQPDVTADVSNPDTGTSDTGTPDTGTPDTGTPDTGMPDTGTPEAGNDAGIAALNAHCAKNNGGAPCTATELLLIEKDTNPDGSGKGGATAFSCYDCMETSGCIDDSVFNSDVNHECGDTSASGITMPTLHGDSATTACLNVVSCILAHSTCTDSNGAGTCYCGTAVGSQCTMAGLPNGPCLTEEEDGLDTTDPVTANTRFTNTAYAGGMANTLFSCAGSNTCTTCYQ